MVVHAPAACRQADAHLRDASAVQLVLLDEAGAWDVENPKFAVAEATRDVRLRRMARKRLHCLARYIKLIPAQRVYPLPHGTAS
jgi:hypothetical protein